jgi:proteasome accessory factor B
LKSPKIQRWIDLLVALLRHHYPVTFEQLIAEVPAYSAGQKEESRRRNFERDKDELRSFGVSIETIQSPEGEVIGYRLDPRRFYLPYLTLRSEGRATPGPGRSTSTAIAAWRP